MSFVATGIDAAITTDGSGGPLNGVSEFMLRKFVPYSVSIGTNVEADVVLEFKSPTAAYVSVSAENAMRMRNALRKGDNWCAELKAKGVDARKLIDGWDATGTAVSGGGAGSVTPMRVEMWVEAAGGGERCFVGFSGKVGILNTRFLLARDKLRQVDAAIASLPAAAADLAHRMSRASEVVNGLR